MLIEARILFGLLLEEWEMNVKTLRKMSVSPDVMKKYVNYENENLISKCLQGQ